MPPRSVSGWPVQEQLESKDGIVSPQAVPQPAGGTTDRHTPHSTTWPVDVCSGLFALRPALEEQIAGRMNHRLDSRLDRTRQDRTGQAGPYLARSDLLEPLSRSRSRNPKGLWSLFNLSFFRRLPTGQDKAGSSSRPIHTQSTSQTCQHVVIDTALCSLTSRPTRPLLLFSLPSSILGRRETRPAGRQRQDPGREPLRLPAGA